VIIFFFIYLIRYIWTCCTKHSIQAMLRMDKSISREAKMRRVYQVLKEVHFLKNLLIILAFNHNLVFYFSSSTWKIEQILK
jgi:hypothetical protein